MTGVEGGRARTAATVAAAAVVFAIALYLRSGAFAGGSIEWDEADYAYATTRGFWTNWWDQSAELNGDLRHWHAPLSMYLVALSTGAFGMVEWAVRLPGVIASACACALMTLAAYDIVDGPPRLKLAAGCLGGLLLATAPASIGMTQPATPHSLVELFLVLNLWCLARYIREPSAKGAALFGLSLGGQFVTMEYGFIILGLATIAVMLAAAARDGLAGRTLSLVRGGRDLLACGVACGAVVLALWPAGLFKAGVVDNLMHYLQYAGQSSHAAWLRGRMYRPVPKWAYVWWYWESYPALLVAMLVGLLLLGVWAYRTRRATPMFLGVFAAGLVAAVHASHIMRIKYSSFAIPPVLLGGVLAGAWSWRGLFQSGREVARAPRALAAAAILALAAAGAAGGSTAPRPRNAGNDNLRRLAMRVVPLLEPGARVVAYPWPILRYHAHLEFGRTDIQIFEFLPNTTRLEAQALKRLQEGQAGWAFIREPVGGIGDSPVFKFLVTRYILEDQEGNVRLFRRPGSGVIP